MITDKTITCQECSALFLFTAGEQEFFQAKGLANEPKRCPNCRVLCRVLRAGRGEESTTQVDCATCGKMTRVPFTPRGHRPVFCSNCLRVHKQAPAEQAAVAV